MAFQSRARKLPSLLDGKLQEFRNAGRRKEKGRDQAGSLKLVAYSISKWPIGAPAVISSVCRCSRNQIQRAVAFLINFLFRKHENSPLGKVHPAFRLLPVVFSPLRFPTPRAVLVKKMRGTFLDRKIPGRVPGKQMREDQSAPRAHRTGLIIFMILCHGCGGSPRWWDTSFPSSCNESLPRKRAVRPSSYHWQRPAASWPEYILLPFISRRPYLITYCDDRRLGELMDVDIENERKHGKRDDSDTKMKQFTGYTMKRDSSKWLCYFISILG